MSGEPVKPKSGKRKHLFALLTDALPPRSPVPRRPDLDTVRGIAILLVVVGHVVPGEVPTGNDWYFVLRVLIYKFHMPLFMTLAGISFALALPGFASWRSVSDFSRAKVARLAVAYLFFGLLILIGKLIAANFMHVDGRVPGSVEDIAALILRPSDSAAKFLWFIYVLGLYFVALPAFLQLTGRRPIVLFLLALAAQSVEWPSAFLLDRFFEYLPFFSGGMLLWQCRERWSTVTPGVSSALAVVFFIALALSFPLDLPKWFVGALSVPALIGLAQHLPTNSQHSLGSIGKLSFSIYLMNTLAIGITKALMLKLFPWDGLNFLIYFPVLTAAGVTIPIAVKRLVGARFRTIDRFV